MTGIEAQARSRLGSVPTPVELRTRRYDNFMTAKFHSFAEAAEYARRLDGNVTDSHGRPVAFIHKGAKAARPPAV